MNFKHLMPLGTKLFAVHKHYDKKNISGAKIIVCRITSYQNCNGKLMPVLVMVGKKNEVSTETHTIYPTLERAAKAITKK